jgi:hypothetical protein
MKPKVDSYASLKKEMRVESVCRSWLLEGASRTVELISLSWIELVTMALWVTLRGIMVLGTGVFNTI